MYLSPFRVWLKKQFARPMAARPRRRRHPERIQALEPRCLLAAQLAITPITWNVIGLDSNTAGWKDGQPVGPNVFLVGARITNTGDSIATDLNASFQWDDTGEPRSSFINLAGGSLPALDLGSLEAGESRLAFFNVEVDRDTTGGGSQSTHFSRTLGNTVASDPATTRRYHIAASAHDPSATTTVPLTVATPANRELFVERLLSQSRNGVRSIIGPTEVEKGKTYDFIVNSFTATEGYQELQDELVFPNQIFRIDKIEAVYAQPLKLTTPNLGTASNPNPTVFADAGQWNDVPTSPTYRSPTNTNNQTDRAGGDPIRTKYTVTVIGEGEARVTDSIRDYSGSSFHYNSDWGQLVHTVVSEPLADLSIIKDDAATVAIPGSSVTYTFTVGNAGPAPVTGAIVQDVLPVGTTFRSGSEGVIYDTETRSFRYVTGTILKNASTVFTVTLDLDPSLTGSLSNTATVSPPSTITDPNPSNNTDDDVDLLTPQVDVGVTKDDHSLTAIPGSTTTYTIVVSNTGPSTATNIQVTDSLPAIATGLSWSGSDNSSGTGSLSTVILSLLPGASVTYSYVVAIDPAATGSLDNLVTVTTDHDSNSDNNQDNDLDQLTAEVDLSILKSNGADTVVPGTVTTYTITVANAGPSTVTGATVTDTLPTGTTFVSATHGATYDTLSNTISYVTGTLATSGSESFSITLRLDPSLTGELTNTAAVAPPTGVTDTDLTNNSDDDRDTLMPDVDVAVSKTDNRDFAIPGSSTTYEIVVSNLGPSTAYAVQVTDAVPEGATGATWSGNGTTGTGSLNTIIDRVLPGETVIFTCTVDISPSAVGVLKNVATVIAANNDKDDNNTAIDVDLLIPHVDLSLNKDNGTSTVVPGTPTTYSITITNAGPSAVTGATVTDTLPAGTTFVGSTAAQYSLVNNVFTYTTGTLDVNGSEFFTITLLVDASLTGSLTNTASVAPPDGVTDTNSTNDSDDDVDTLTPEVDLSILKSNSADTVVPGTNTTYTITIANAGPSTVTGATVTDTLPDGTSYVSGSPGVSYDLDTNTISYVTGTLATSGSESFAITLLLDPSLIGELANTAAVAPPTGVIDTDLTNNSDDDRDILIPDVDLEVTKTDGSEVAVPGSTTTYTIVVKNLGPSTATDVSVDDTLPASATGVSWTATDGSRGNGALVNTIETLLPGASITYTYEVAIDPSARGELKNVVVVADDDDTEVDNNTAEDIDTLTPQVDLSLTKDDGVATVIPGKSTTYTLVVTNSGPSTISGATIEDPLPLGASFDSGSTGVQYDGTTNTISYVTGLLAKGDSEKFTITLTIDPSATGSVTNVAKVSPPVGVTDTNAGNDNATDTDTLTPQVDVAVTKTDNTDIATPGTDTTYTIVVTNNGPSTASDVRVFDPLPEGASSGTWWGDDASGLGDLDTTIALLKPGSSMIFTYTVSIAESLAAPLVNTVTVSAENDQDSGNNTFTDTDTLAADLAVSKDNFATAVIPGTTTSYTITVSNVGPSIVTGAVVTDRLPVGTLYRDQSNGVTYDSSSNTISYVTGTLAPGETESFVLTLFIDPSLTGTLENWATVTMPAGVTDTQPVNNRDDDSDPLTPQNDVSVTKTDNRSAVAAGSSTTYIIVVSNAGPSTATAVVLKDTLPSGTTSGTWSGNDKSGTGSINTTIATLLPGTSLTFTYTVSISSSLLGTLSNTATVTSSHDINLANNSATDIDVVQNGKTLGYYSNKNGQADLTGSTTGTTLKSSIYDALFGAGGVLVKDAFDSVLVNASGQYLALNYFQNYTNVRNFLLNATATNMANMLSAQLLATEFNILLGRVDPTQSVQVSSVRIGSTGSLMSSTLQESLTSQPAGATGWTQVTTTKGGRATIQTALNAAILQLKTNPNTIASGGNRLFQEALKNIFDAINNNQNIF